MTATNTVMEALAAAKKDTLNAILGVYDSVDAQVETVKGSKGSLAGIPIAIKNNILVEGELATAGSKILENYKATYDATVIKKLREAGAVMIARTNMDEFAMGSSGENSAYGPTKNPHDMTRVPGGSSSGSAAAVAAGIVSVALGTDTGGSVRQPAAFCGVVGLKPTYGAVSRYGAIAMGSSLDQVGQFGKTVSDVEKVFNVVKGRDSMDSTTVDYVPVEKEVKKIGVPRKMLELDGIDADVLENFESSLEILRSKGYEIVDIDVENIQHSLAVYYVISPAEVSANLARYDGIRYGLSLEGENLVDGYFKTRTEGIGKEVQRRIMVGTYVLSAGYVDAYYNKANAVRSTIKNSFSKVFQEVDLIVTPTTPTPAFKIGEKVQDPLQMYMADIFTVPANIAGIPGMSIPSGTVSREGIDLPLGLQLLGPNFSEPMLFATGKRFLGEA